MVADHIPVMFDALPGAAAVPGGRSGIAILGIADRQRLPSLPDVPTIAEGGLPGFEFTAWGALLAPAGTPPEVVAKLNAAANAALADPGVRKQLSDLGYEVVGGTPAALGTLIAQDYLAKKDLLRAASIHTN